MKDIQLLDSIKIVNEKIAKSAMRSGRSIEEVKLIAVTKNVESKIISQAIEIGLREFGENRVQEARDKIPTLKSQINSTLFSFKKRDEVDLRINWHMVGHLQKNKTKIAVHLFDLIQSVDSIELAEEINKQAEKMGKIQRIFVQVKLSDEESKYGILKEELMELFGLLNSMGNLKTEGLMTIPPFFYDPERSRPYFVQLRELKGRLKSSGYEISELSMGMSNDFEIAIDEGATMVRVGTAIFGERRR